MNLERRVELLKLMGEYLASGSPEWEEVEEKAAYENPWFIPRFIDFQVSHIAGAFLTPDAILEWIGKYTIPPENASPKNIGIVMAGNIPLAGFHDFLCAFVSGNRQTLKPSSKDQVLIRGIVNKLHGWDEETKTLVNFADSLKGCDAYIATGSNNSARYFEYYFSKFPHIIRKNRTSAAILSGQETPADLDRLADDVYLYFGLGCRNVTKIYVPEGYDFIPLLDAFRKYEQVTDHHKYRNNYDYQLAVMIINKIFYMTNGSILLQRNDSLFSPISQLHYDFYSGTEELSASLSKHPDIQCVVGKGQIPFGQAQRPALDDYADGVDTLAFMLDISKTG